MKGQSLATSRLIYRLNMNSVVPGVHMHSCPPEERLISRKHSLALRNKRTNDENEQQMSSHCAFSGMLQSVWVSRWPYHGSKGTVGEGGGGADGDIAVG